jgi:hypothetical protein
MQLERKPRMNSWEAVPNNTVGYWKTDTRGWDQRKKTEGSWKAEERISSQS